MSLTCGKVWQTEGMARGWESKGVESQIDSTWAKSARKDPVPRTPEEAQKRREREGLELSRTRIQRQLESATNPRRRESLEAALRFLEEKIAALN
jgi:hypothetical protein